MSLLRSIPFIFLFSPSAPGHIHHNVKCLGLKSPSFFIIQLYFVILLLSLFYSCLLYTSRYEIRATKKLRCRIYQTTLPHIVTQNFPSNTRMCGHTRIVAHTQEKVSGIFRPICAVLVCFTPFAARGWD